MKIELLLCAVDGLRKMKRIEHLNLHYPGKTLSDGSEVYLFDTKSENENEPWISFCVTFKPVLFSSQILPIDKEAHIPDAMDLDKKHMLRIAHTIFKSYKQIISDLHSKYPSKP